MGVHCRALANKPELLLLDEPTGDLDSKNSEVVMKLLTDLNCNHLIECFLSIVYVGA